MLSKREFFFHVADSFVKLNFYPRQTEQEILAQLPTYSTYSRNMEGFFAALGSV
jgi:hypothetical protein